MNVLKCALQPVYKVDHWESLVRSSATAAHIHFETKNVLSTLRQTTKYQLMYPTSRILHFSRVGVILIWDSIPFSVGETVLKYV